MNTRTVLFIVGGALIGRYAPLPYFSSGELECCAATHGTLPTMLGAAAGFVLSRAL